MTEKKSTSSAKKSSIKYEEGQVPGSIKIPRKYQIRKIIVFFIIIASILITFPLINRIGPWLSNPGLKGPYLSWTDDPSTSMTITIQTPDRCKLEIEYGPSGHSGYPDNLKDSENRKDHVFTITGLSPDTKYKYIIKSNNDNTWGLDAKSYRFRTAPDSEENFEFVIYGDNRIGNFKADNHINIVNAILSEDGSAFTLNVGDLVHRPENKEQWDRFFWEIKDLASEKPYFSALGNHEYDEGNNPDYGDNYRKFFSFPKNGRKEMYYSFNYSNAHFSCLNMSTGHLKISDEEIDWFKADLKKNTGKWNIVYFHVPPYSSGGHSENEEIIDKMVPIFEKYEVVVISGHDHHYEHMIVDDIHYFITGGGGAPLNIENNKKPYSEYMEITFSYTLVEIDGDEMTLTTKRTDGSIVDEVIIEK